MRLLAEWRQRSYRAIARRANESEDLIRRTGRHKLRGDSLSIQFLSALNQLRGFVAPGEAEALKVDLDREPLEPWDAPSQEHHDLGPGLAELVYANGYCDTSAGFAELERLEFQLLARLFVLGRTLTQGIVDPVLMSRESPRPSPIVNALDSTPEGPEEDEALADELAPMDSAFHAENAVPIHDWLTERSAIWEDLQQFTIARIDRLRADSSSPRRRARVDAIHAGLEQLEDSGETCSGDVQALVSRWRALKCSLATSHIRLVLFKAYPLRGALSLREALLSGIRGLQIAVHRYDLRYRCQFSTYATHWIAHGIRRAAADHGVAVRVPVHEHERIRRFAQAVAHLRGDALANLTAQELACLANVELDEAQRVQALVRTPKTHSGLHYPTPFATLFDDTRLRPSQATPPPQERGELVRRDKLLRAAMAQLLSPESSVAKNVSQRMRMHDVLTSRLNLGANRGHTLKQIGERHGISRERVRQLETEGLGQLARLIAQLDRE